MPTFILIRPTVWPQYNNVTDRTGRTGQTGQRSDSIGRTVLQTVAQTLHTFVRGAGAIKLGTLVILLVKQMSNISQGSVNPATCFRCGGHLSDIHCKFTDKSDSERVLKIGYHLANSRTGELSITLWTPLVDGQVFAQTRRLLSDGNFTGSVHVCAKT